MRFGKWLKIAALAALCLGVSGCTLPLLPLILDSWSWPEGAPSDAQVARSFYQTTLTQSSSADVLSTIYNPKYELLSQSESVLASCGEKKKGRKKWLNMVAFDENELTARRKYFVIVDEAPSKVLGRQKCRIDIEMIADAEMLESPYADENARRIAILRRVLENFTEDALDVRQDNKILDVCAMVVNRTFNGILTYLDTTPARAIKLTDLSGLDFDHMMLGRGKIRMVVRGDIVKVKIKIGSVIRNFRSHRDVKNM